MRKLLSVGLLVVALACAVGASLATVASAFDVQRGDELMCVGRAHDTNDTVKWHVVVFPGKRTGAALIGRQTYWLAESPAALIIEGPYAPFASEEKSFVLERLSNPYERYIIDKASGQYSAFRVEHPGTIGKLLHSSQPGDPGCENSPKK